MKATTEFYCEHCEYTSYIESVVVDSLGGFDITCPNCNTHFFFEATYVNEPENNEKEKENTDEER